MYSILHALFSISRYAYTCVPVDNYLRELRRHIGKEWKALARALGLSTTDIDAIEHENLLNLKEQIHQLTVVWRRRQGDDASVAKVVRALHEAELHNVARTTEQNLALRSKRLARLSGDTSPPSLLGHSASSDSDADSDTAHPVQFEVNDAVMVPRSNAAPWYGVVKYIGNPLGTGKLMAGLELVSVSNCNSVLLSP